MEASETKQPHRKPLHDETNMGRPSYSFTRILPQTTLGSKLVQLGLFYLPLGEFELEANPQDARLAAILLNHSDWSIRMVKNFQNTRADLKKKFHAKLKPLSPLCCVGQKVFLSTETLHCCIAVENLGYIWLNRLAEESFIRINWTEDPSASVKSLPHLNLCFDLDETLIFNSTVRNCPASFQFVVPDAPHVLRSEADQDTGSTLPSSDKPLRRPLITEFLNLVTPFFHNIRIATFSVQNRAEEIIHNLDPKKNTLLKNHRCHITGATQRVVYAREALLHQCTSRLEAQMNNGNKFGEQLPSTWFKSLDMLDFPKDGLMDRSIIIDDRTDVWTPANQDNIVKICGPDEPQMIGNAKYINGHDGGELGMRIAIALVNLELRATGSAAYIQKCCNQKLASPVRITGKKSHHSGYPASKSPPNSPSSSSPNSPMYNKENTIHSSPNRATFAYKPLGTHLQREWYSTRKDATLFATQRAERRSSF